MILLGKCAAQFARNLLACEEITLVTDRDNGDNPEARFYSDDENKKLVIKILNDINIDEMTSNPSAGAKNRTDIHFNDSQLDAIISILEPFINSLEIEFDDTPRNSPDPTGMEHPDGLPLGITQNITWIKAMIKVNYADKGFSIIDTSKMYIDAEEYWRGKKYHFGVSMNTNFEQKNLKSNSFEILIDYNQLKRLLNSMNVAKIWFSR